MRKLSICFIVLILIYGCKGNRIKALNENNKETQLTENIEEDEKSPLFKNSIVSTDIDFIKTTDPDAFLSMSYVGQAAKEMPGGKTDELFDENTYVFKATFKNNKKVEIWAHSDFGSKEAAKIYADKLSSKLGKLPNFMRDVLDHVVIHKGDATAFAEDAGRFFVLYSDNMDTRISNNDLEETVFHETAHVTFDLKYAKSKVWKEIQIADKTFITEYAESKPYQEDISETALFVYTMKTYPNRLSPEIEQWIKINIPKRYEFLEKFF
ncbi:hypothetical protein [Hyunsoonleella pacifica]|uniref:Uncharacterized protein n=1 Tax=Hyunsoonleella pacifica TaxID=1080224 RepID=A0A4Q9FWJ8_9FLAO|nr:hypothetical protein [Hyunsoonleella pacifica]TBN18762.1 hypothetical protein EYD46_01475 [Hyunsoonleella pacifica]GGD04521.1 hypothetical protein GCM10011368_02960 [Hyunsoonleella pacifica]